MKRYKLYSYLVILTMAVFGTSCTSSTRSTDTQEISAMDSISNDLEKTNKELEEETKKVEASLDKIDKEFNTSK